MALPIPLGSPSNNGSFHEPQDTRYFAVAFLSSSMSPLVGGAYFEDEELTTIVRLTVAE
jgi:hypothetical protein